MTVSRTLRVALLIGMAIGMLGSDILSGSGFWSVVSTAEARVGRPLSPVSVAGAARRTVRRCAVGVYEC
jgi:hypothetical protein